MAFTRNLNLTQKIQKGQSFLLMGPRQTGKSTLIEKAFGTLPNPKLKYYLQLPSTAETLANDPETILREVLALHSKKSVPIFIDEIQKLPQLLDVLQFLIDQKKVVLAATGSSARQLRKFKANWLPGRIHLEHLYPLTWSEIQSNPQSLELADILIFGSLPGILSQPDLATRCDDLNAYAHLYLEEEIRAEAVTRNLPRFTRFLRMAALESGTSPNFSKVAQTLGVSHTTIADYYKILEDTLIVKNLPAFGKNRDQVLRSPKYYFFDVGVRNAAAQLPLEKGLLNLQMGLLFEHTLILQAQALATKNTNLSYYRTKQGQEVDLICETHNQCTAFEIKATKKPIQNDFYGLDYFCEKHHCDQSFLVCQVEKSQKFGNHTAISWVEFFKMFASL